MESHQSFWLIDAEVERLNDVPVVGSEVQGVGTECELPGIDRDQCECHVGKRFDGELDAQSILSSTLGSAGTAFALTELVASAEFVDSRDLASVVTAGSFSTCIGLRRGNVNIVDKRAFSQVAGALSKG